MGISPDLLQRIRGEFLEMPGMKLTAAQACRLWNLKEAPCRDALDALIAEGFLIRTLSGAFIAPPSAVRTEKATIPGAGWSGRCPHCRHLNSVSTDHASRRASITFRCTACSRIIVAAPASA